MVLWLVLRMVHVGCSQVEVVSEFTYLGACTTCDGSSESEILRCIAIVRNCMMLLEKHVWKSHIQIDTKVRLFQAFKPMFSRCWCMLPKREQSQRLVLGDWMPFFDTWSLRKIHRIPYIRHVTNASVWKTSSCRLVSSIFKTRRLCFFGHMACSDSRQDHHRAIKCVAPSTKRLEEASRAPTYHLAEGDWCWCTVDLTSVYTQPGRRPTIVVSGDVSLT